MSQLLYTNTDKIRSTLGLTISDVSDEQLLARDLDKELKLDLTGWLPTHATLYADGTSTTADDAAQTIADALSLYAMYYCALLEVPVLRLAAPQQISDGKNTLSRFTPLDWQQMEARLAERVAYYKDQLLQLVSQVTPVTTIKLFEGAGLANDPVTSAP